MGIQSPRRNTTMKFKSFAFSILAALVLMVGSAFSQIKPYVDAGVGYQSTFTGTSSVTASNPSFNLGAGVELNSKLLLIDVNGQFNTQNVRNFANYNTSAFAGTVTGTGYAKIGKNLLLGGGALYQDTVINGNFKGLIPTSATTFVPLVGGGFQFSRDRVTALYELPGRSATNQRTVLLHNEFYVTKSGSVRLTQDVSGNSSVAQITSSGPLSQRISGAQGSAGIKFVF